MVNNSMHEVVAYRYATPDKRESRFDLWTFDYQIVDELMMLTGLERLEVFCRVGALIEMAADRLYLRRCGIEEMRLGGDAGFLRLDHTHTVYHVEKWNWKETDWVDSFTFDPPILVSPGITQGMKLHGVKGKGAKRHVRTDWNGPRSVGSIDDGRFEGLDRE